MLRARVQTAITDLAVFEVDGLNKAAESLLETVRKNSEESKRIEQSMNRSTTVIAISTAIYGLVTVAFYIHEWCRHP